jgi:hypothetical protein
MDQAFGLDNEKSRKEEAAALARDRKWEQGLETMRWQETCNAVERARLCFKRVWEVEGQRCSCYEPLKRIDLVSGDVTLKPGCGCVFHSDDSIDLLRCFSCADDFVNCGCRSSMSICYTTAAKRGWVPTVKVAHSDKPEDHGFETKVEIDPDFRREQDSSDEEESEEVKEFPRIKGLAKQKIH